MLEGFQASSELPLVFGIWSGAQLPGFTVLAQKLDALLRCLKLDATFGNREMCQESLRRYGRRVICNLSDQGPLAER